MGNLLILLLLTQTSWGHGEDKPGPNKGFIRMPAGYHTEVLPDGKHRLKVWLLDVNFKNPTVKNSSLEITHEGERKTKASCEAKGRNFLCTFPNAVDLTKQGKLLVESSREGQKGMDVAYDLPLRLLPAAADKKKHKHHGHH
jgi:hypothetical protein